MYTYSSLIVAYSKSGDVKRAEASFSRMKEEGIKPDVYTYNTVEAAYSKGGDVKRLRMLKRNSWRMRRKIWRL